MKRSLTLIIFAALVLSLTCPGALLAAKRKKAQSQTVENKGVSEELLSDALKQFEIGSKKDRAAIIKKLRSLAKKYPNEPMLSYYIGTMLCEEGYNTPALKYFLAALPALDGSADIHLKIAGLLEEKNKTDEALVHYQKALSLDDSCYMALFKLGLHNLSLGEKQKAYEMLNKAHNLKPDSAPITRALGEQELELGMPEAAVQTLNQALLFDETHAKTHFLLARAYKLLSDNKQAASHLALAKKYGKKDELLIESIGYNLPRSLADSGRYEEAEAEYKKEIKKNSDKATGYFELGALYESMGSENKAIKAYIKAFELNKELSEGIMRAADIYYSRDNTAKTAEMLEMLKRDAKYKDEAIRRLSEMKNEEFISSQYALKEAAESSNAKAAETEAAYYAMIDADKTNADAYEALQRFYEERGAYDMALKMFQKYNRLNPTSAGNKKLIKDKLKKKLEHDNYLLFGGKQEEAYKDSTVTDSELLNLASNGDNDRLKETAMLILLTRKDYKKDKNVIEGLVEFYTERGYKKEAKKYINMMKRNGYYTDAEAKAAKDAL